MPVTSTARAASRTDIARSAVVPDTSNLVRVESLARRSNLIEVSSIPWQGSGKPSEEKKRPKVILKTSFSSEDFARTLKGPPLGAACLHSQPDRPPAWHRHTRLRKCAPRIFEAPEQILQELFPLFSPKPLIALFGSSFGDDLPPNGYPPET